MKNILIVVLLVALVGALFFGLEARNKPQTEALAATPVEVAGTTTTEEANAVSPAAGPESATTTPQAATESAAEPANGSGMVAFSAPDVIYGDSNAPVVIEEYASYSCSHCADFHKNVLPQLKEKYLDGQKAVLRAKSFVRNQPDLAASLLVACQPDNAARQRFSKALFEAQDSWALVPDFSSALKAIAKVGGMSDAQVDACMADKKMETAILAVRQEGTEKRKVESTPTFFVNGTLLKGAHDITAFDALINGEKTGE